MRWFGAGARQHVRNNDERFDVNFRTTQASIAWSGHTQGDGGFTSDAASTSKTLFGMLGQERNGVFFSDTDDDDDDDDHDDHDHDDDHDDHDHDHEDEGHHGDHDDD